MIDPPNVTALNLKYVSPFRGSVKNPPDKFEAAKVRLKSIGYKLLIFLSSSSQVPSPLVINLIQSPAVGEYVPEYFKLKKAELLKTIVLVRVVNLINNSVPASNLNPEALLIRLTTTLDAVVLFNSMYLSPVKGKVRKFVATNVEDSITKEPLYAVFSGISFLPISYQVPSPFVSNLIQSPFLGKYV